MDEIGCFLLRQEGRYAYENLACLNLQIEIHSLVEDDGVFPTLKVNHRKLHDDKHRETNMITTNVWNKM